MPDQLLTASADRLRALDPLLGLDTEPPAGGEVLTAGAARGWARVVDLDPSAAAATWSRLRTYALTPRWTEPADLDALLARWVRWTRAAGAAEAGPDSQTALTWPSRDVAAGRLFVAHGLSPSTTIAVRPRGRAAHPAPPPPGVTVRRGSEGDAGTVVALTVEDLRYEGGLSPVGERPGHEELRRREAAELLAGPDPWAWIAERDGRPVGALTASRPADATWISGLTSARPAAYLSLLSVAPGARGGGIGAALVALAQRAVDGAGVAATLLHYGTFNPLSAPFWSRLGWRPLWTVWAAQPAAAMR